MKNITTFTATLLLAAGAQAACYTVVGAQGQILSETSTPPVDMSYPLHQTVPYKYGPGATLVFGLADGNCGPAAADSYDDLQATPVGYREDGSSQRVRSGTRAPRRDRE